MSPCAFVHAVGSGRRKLERMAGGTWTVVDAFAGLGGFGIAAAADERVRRVVGVEVDGALLKFWKKLTMGECVQHTIESVGKFPPVLADARSHLHWSSPCQSFSSAKRNGGDPAALSERANGERLFRLGFQMVLHHDLSSFSLENVASPPTLAIAREYKVAHPRVFDFVVLDAVDFGVPTSRRRLIVSSPGSIRRLNERASVHRKSMRQAFEERGLPLPAAYVQNSNSNTPPRSIEGAGFCVVAAHAPMWTGPHGETVRVASPQESAVLLGLPPNVDLPKNKRAAQRAVGNAIPPPLSKAILEAALGAAEEPAPIATPALGDESVGFELRVSALERRVAELEAEREGKRARVC